MMELGTTKQRILDGKATDFVHEKFPSGILVPNFCQRQKFGSRAGNGFWK